MGRMKTYRLEHDEQAALFAWTRWQHAKYPELRLMFAIPNGGHRNILVARKMKEEGVKAGVPDIFLPVARQGFHGLFLEMKTEANRPSRGGKGGLSDLQAHWIGELREQGYRAEVAYGRDEAVAILEDYLREPRPEYGTGGKMMREPKPDADGWMPHVPGDPMPCALDDIIVAMLRDGHICEQTPAYLFCFAKDEHSPNEEIIAWKPANP